MRLLIIEDHVDIAASLGEYFEGRGHTVDYAGDGLVGLHLAAVNDYDALILDLGLPGLDGLSLCQRLRQDGGRAVPILMLTARDGEADKLAGFAVGTDDYVTKPFSMAEVEARVQALVRRAAGRRDGVRLGELSLDKHCHRARYGSRDLHLTPLQFRLMERLMAESPAPVPRTRLEADLWGDEPPGSDAALRVHVQALRQALASATDTVRIETVHGVGYRLVARREPES